MATSSPPAEKKCDACELPPHDPTKPLLQCARCKSAQYHDVTCQRNHYPTHKAECRRAAAAAAASARRAAPLSAASSVSSQLTSSSSSLVECRVDKVKGRSLFAMKLLPIGCHPFSSTTKVHDDDGLCESIVQPVLLEHMRKLRCSYCFRKIPDDQNKSFSVPNYYCSASPCSALLHKHCSHECRKLDTNWVLEERAARTLSSPPSSMVLSCSRLLRKFVQFPSSMEEFNSLSFGGSAEWILPKMPSSTDEKTLNDLAILMTKCKLFLKAMGDDQGANLVHTRFIPDLLITSSHFIRRINTNGFMISDAEQNHIGMGLYMKASVINHACRPNTIPTFWLRPQKPPMLQLTVVTPIDAGEEITISYCDASTPRLHRNRTLLQDYNFMCDCNFCHDTTARDDDIYGLYCTKKSCVEKKARLRSKTGHNNNLLDNYYTCELCGRKRSDEGAQSSTQLFSVIYESGNSIKGAIDYKRKALRRMKSSCRVETSYFYAVCAKHFVSTICNSLPQITDEGERMDLVKEALTAMSKSRSASKFCFDFPGSLQWILQGGEEAKLRLYANSNDVGAWNMLNEAKEKMLYFYPRCDETIMSLHESLESYRIGW